MLSGIDAAYREHLRLHELPMFRRPPSPPLVNTDEHVDCSPFRHILYRPTCQTVRLEKRRRAARRERRRRLPTILENLCMFEWLHRTEAHKGMSNDELLFVLLNGLFHQNKGNVAIVINKDQTSGKSATSRMEAAFGKTENKEEAVKNFMAAQNSPTVPVGIPPEMKDLDVLDIMKTSGASEDVGTPSDSTPPKTEIVVTMG